MTMFSMGFVVLITLVLVIGAIVLFLSLIIGPYFLAWKLGRFVNNKTAQRDSRGDPIARTSASRFGLGNLSPAAGLLAGVGQSAMPQMSLNSLILRPTIGMRLISFATAAVLAVMFAIDDGSLFPRNIYVIAGLVVLVAYGLLHTNTYSLRYDTEGFTTRDDFFRQRTAAWRDVISVQDNGHYLYVIQLENGSKLNVPKYLVGIRDFLTYAKDQMAYHNRT